MELGAQGRRRVFESSQSRVLLRADGGVRCVSMGVGGYRLSCGLRCWCADRYGSRLGSACFLGFWETFRY